MAEKLSRVGMIGNNLIDADAEMGRLPHGIKDRRAWRLADRNLQATEETLNAWLESHGIKARVMFDSHYGVIMGVGVEVLE
jgi:hypothetical protein